MNAEVIAIGTELLLGQIVNMNAPFIAQKLADAGHNLYYQTVVGDNDKRLTAVFKQAQQRANLIIVTGGLGPTQDDITKETLARLLQRSLVKDTVALAKIQQHFEGHQQAMASNNLRQADVIEGATILANKTGFSPGMLIVDHGITYVLMPGVPREMKPMFENVIAEHLTLKATQPITSRVLRFYGIGEPQLADALDTLITSETNPTLATYAGTYEVTLRISAVSTPSKRAAVLLDEMEAEVQALVGTFFYGYGEKGLETRVIEQLKQKRLMLSAAESLTAGLFQATIANHVGVSPIFKGGMVTYATSVKTDLLGVDAALIEREGVVSKGCAQAMAEQIRILTQTDIGVSFTGVAGPSAQDGHPAGTVWLAISTKTETTTHLYHFTGDRQSNRERAVKQAFWLLNQRFS